MADIEKLESTVPKSELRKTWFDKPIEAAI